MKFHKIIGLNLIKKIETALTELSKLTKQVEQNDIILAHEISNSTKINNSLSAEITYLNQVTSQISIIDGKIKKIQS